MPIHATKIASTVTGGADGAVTCFGWVAIAMTISTAEIIASGMV